MIKLSRIEVRTLRMPLISPFETSFGRESVREVLLIAVHTADGLTGWGECSAFSEPLYNEEDNTTARHILADYIIPSLLDQPVDSPQDYAARFAYIRGNRMAKAALEDALWDIAAQQVGKPLWRYLGGVRQQLPAGVSIGIAANDAALVEQVADFLEQGYQRIKIKIKPGRDVAPTAAVRARFPDVPLQVDANSAYTLAPHHLAALKALDDYRLLLIEQPLGEDDIVDHATLQAQLATPICLDESIRSRDDARKAYQLDAARIINIKRGRVGGITEALAIHDYCRANGIAVWCGGMLETGVGRAINLALATLPGFTMVGDLSASNRFYAQDIIAAPFTLLKSGPRRGTISVPNS
ncbi:MAG: o-succinylbenzoate synthase, partial [Candidatus Chloroheliales bacterium]